MSSRWRQSATSRQRFYQDLVDHALDVILVLDAEGIFKFVSPSVTRALGYPRQSLIGRNVFEIVHPDDHPQARQGIAEVMAAPGNIASAEGRLRHADGSWRVMAGVGRCLPEDAEMDGIVVNLRDVTEYREAERELRDSERRFRDLAETTSDVLWAVDENAVFTYVSPKVRDILGYEPEDMIGRTPFEFVPPEERERVRRLTGAVIAERKAFVQLEHGMLRKDGRSVAIETSAVPIVEEDGTFGGWRGIDRDITERKRVEEELQQQAGMVGLLFRLAAVANEAENIGEATQRFLDEVCAHTGWPIGHAWALASEAPAALTSTNIWHLDDPKRFAPFREISAAAIYQPGVGLPGRVLASGEPAWTRPRDFNLPRARIAEGLGLETGFALPVLVGREVAGVLEFHTTELVEPDQALIDVLNNIGTLLGRVTERARHLRALEDLALRDALTGLASLRLGKDLAEAALARARRDKTKVALMFVDLDGFKAVNDTLGHEAGDAVLKEVAARLMSHTRATDAVARFGGDEFLVLIGDVRADAAVAHVAGKLVESINAPCPLDCGVPSVSASIGIAVYPDHAVAVDDLIRRADEAMYAAKRDGKNGFRFAEAGGAAAPPQR